MYGYAMYLDQVNQRSGTKKNMKVKYYIKMCKMLRYRSCITKQYKKIIYNVCRGIYNQEKIYNLEKITFNQYISE